MSDARFEDGAESPLRLIARGTDDLQVISALVQDGVLTGADMQYARSRRRFSLLLNRYRWEDADSARGARAERVRCVLDFADVLGVTHQGLARDKDVVLSLLSVTYEAETPNAETPNAETPDAEGIAGPGRVVLTFAGDGALALQVECLEVTLADVTRPYRAPSGAVPQHRD